MNTAYAGPLKICANRTGSGFSGRVCIVSVTYVSARNRTFRSRRLHAGSLHGPKAGGSPAS
jgi:hypothetical protein